MLLLVIWYVVLSLASRRPPTANCRRERGAQFVVAWAGQCSEMGAPSTCATTLGADPSPMSQMTMLETVGRLRPWTPNIVGGLL